MISALEANARSKKIAAELNQIKQSEITKALDEIEVLIINSIKNGEFSIHIESIDGLSNQTFGKISGVLVTVLKECGYQARILLSHLAINISWENV